MLPGTYPLKIKNLNTLLSHCPHFMSSTLWPQVLAATFGVLWGSWSTRVAAPNHLEAIELAGLAKELRYTRAVLEQQSPADQCQCESKLVEQSEKATLVRVLFKASVGLEIVFGVCLSCLWCCPRRQAALRAQATAEPSRPRQLTSSSVPSVPEGAEFSEDSDSESVTLTFRSSDTSASRGRGKGQNVQRGPTRPSDLK
jgi:hypothetical protein